MSFFLFFLKSYIVSVYFSEYEQKILILAKLVQKVPENINLRIPSNNSSVQLFSENMIQLMLIFEIEAERNQFVSVKVSEELRKPHFTCPEQILKKKIQKKLFFPSVPDFEQSYRVFEQTSSGVGKKNFIVVKTALYFPEVHFEDKSLWWKSNVFESAYDFEDQKFYGLLERTVWQCHQNCSLWVQTNKLKKQVFEIVFLPFSRLPGRSNYFWHEKFWSVVKTEL